ncbi:DUF4747 family protein [Rheinheimera sp. FR7-31]|uniref:DUF4747 family protein n=1 Tax=Rheinheimera fenheensis TaxID=3152295 RepID=UPI00325F2A9E
MAKQRKLDVGAINITIHPHTAARYVSMFKQASRQRITANIGYKHLAIITGVSSFDPLLRDAVDAPIQGDIVKFTDIDLDGPWLNLENNQEAEESDLESINIPEHLKPNMSRFRFVFFPEKHILFYEAYDRGTVLNPNVATRIFKSIFANSDIVSVYGDVNVTHIPKEDAVEVALKTPRVSSVKFKVTRPNADHFKEQEAEFLAKLNSLHVAEVKQEYKAINGKSIVMDRSMTTLAKIAANNGRFELKGRDDNNKVVNFSTVSHPMIETVFFNPKRETVLSFLYKTALKIWKRYRCQPNKQTELRPHL